MLRFLSLLFCLIAVNAAAEAIRIDDVEVEISASNPVEARERAFLEARRTGYRLALEAAGLTVPVRLSDEQVNAAVTAIEVISERQSANRYSARFSLFVEIADPAGRAIVQPAPPTDVPTPPATPARRGAWIYVIPVERSEGRIDRIWRRDTAWTQSFRAVGPIAGQSPLTPSGDEDDRALVTPARLAAGDAGSLSALGQRHSAPVAAAILDRGPPTRAGRSDGSIQAVEVLYWSRTSGAQSLRHVFTDKTEITTANAIAQALLEQIVSPAPAPAPALPAAQQTPPAIAAIAPDAAKPAPTESAQPIPPPPAPAQISAASAPAEEPPPQTIQPFAYDFASIEEWRRARASLGAIPGLTVAPTTVTTGRIIGQLRYAGSAEALAAQLSAAGLGQARPPAPPSVPRPTPSAAPSAAPSVAPSPPSTPPAPPAPAFPSPPVATEGETGSFAAHLISTRSEAEAITEWGRLTQRFPEVLAGRAPIYRSVDLGADRGVWWRLGVGGFANRRDAEAWCARLAAFNQYCRIAAN